ncbi:hypothetical protein [uncultured Pontibacter sp.]|uniref:hypothetical protein n=1 Tax=uncultured Pontibacter sp. TaxID=453356 RepID=UPI00261D8B9A|nr:hypothetical protein [uncultured Pontibacter sp.]
MTYDLQDLKDLEGKNNNGGVKTRFYFAPESAFAEGGIQEVDADGVTISTPHAFKPGEGFSEIYATLDGAELKLDSVGERDGRGKAPAGEFFHPGNTVAAAQFDIVSKNRPGILLVEEMDGTIVQYGAAGLPIEISGAYTSGKQSGTRRGWTFTVSGYQNGMQHYTGDIALKRNAV